MQKTELPGIEEVIDLLGLERDPRSKRGQNTFNVKCPFCGEGSKNSYKMNINVAKNAYHCFKCSDESGTGVLDLYGRVRLGIRHIKGKDGNGKELLQALLTDLGRPMSKSASCVVLQPTIERPRNKELQIATDQRLHDAFSFILAFPEFKLSQKHKENLMHRGLNEPIIERNGYATMPRNASWIKKYPEYIALYQQANISAEKEKYQRIQSIPDDYMIAGMIVADLMVKNHIKLKGVPGTFVLNNQWFFMYEPGMLIPTRNAAGLIVGIQTRKDSGNLRYMTKSASGLPQAVTSNISKAHFPLGNAPLSEVPIVICTEGPLKADVISCLCSQNTYLVALQGVSNTKSLTKIFRDFRMAHICKIYNGFDMDKCLNTNVRKQSKMLGRKAKAAGLCMSQLCWDEEYGVKLWEYMNTLCIKHQVKPDCLPENNVFIQLASMADALKKHNIPFCIKEENGKETHYYWRDETKGLDDYLLFCKKHHLPIVL